MPPGALSDPALSFADGQADRDAEPDPGRGGQHVDDEGTLSRGTAPCGRVGDRRAGRGRRVSPERSLPRGGIDEAHRGTSRRGKNGEVMSGSLGAAVGIASAEAERSLSPAASQVVHSKLPAWARTALQA